MKVDMITLDAKKAGSVELADGIYGLEPREDILGLVVNWQLAKRRAGTHKVKGRSEISATGRKMYGQKKTGNARHSSRRANVFRGGGVTHGPQVRSHAHDLPKRVRKQGLCYALSAKIKDGSLTVVDSLDVKVAKTKDIHSKIKNLDKGDGYVLFIDGAEVSQTFALAVRNLPGVNIVPSMGANVYDILRHEHLVLSKSAVDALEARLS